MALDAAVELRPVAGGRRRIFCCHRAKLGHRAWPNTAAAVAACVAGGARRIEVDARFLADGALLVYHDEALGGEAGGVGPVAALNRAAAGQLRYPDGSPVAFLEDVVAAIRGSDALLQLDLKGLGVHGPERIEILARALEPIRERVLIGSMAHWNLRPLLEAGFAVAFDPTLHWHHAPGRVGDGHSPAREGRHGLWDDAPLAHEPGVGAEEYVRSRIMDVLALLPASEWMVDQATIRHLGRLGIALGDELGCQGVELAAWTLTDEGDVTSGGALRELFALGVTTIITDAPAELARYAGRLE